MPSELSTYVTLISSDGFEFIVRRECAYISATIKKMLDPTSEPSFHSPNGHEQKRKIKVRVADYIFLL